jgi:predicted NBD/HSP70 family sugar kinase
MLGLQHIVIGGPAAIVTAPLLDAARVCIADRTRSEFRPELELCASSLGADAVLLGAAALVLLSELGVG